MVYSLVLLTLCLVPLANVAYSSQEDYNDVNTSVLEPEFVRENDFTQTRSSSGSPENFQIVSTKLVSIPEKNSTWMQEDWSGGGGQNLWLNPAKFSSSSGLNTISPQGMLELAKGGVIKAWKQFEDGPNAIYQHKMTWSPQKEVFYIFGGYNSDFTKSNKLFEYDPSANTWKEVGKTNPPPERVYSLILWDDVNEAVWIYGGWGTTIFNDLWVYIPATDTWTQKADGPGGRYYHAGAFNPNTAEIIIYGGYIGDIYNPSNEVYVYNIQTNTWTEKKPYLARNYHDAVWVPTTNSMMVFGGIEDYHGSGSYDYVEQVNEYFPDNDTWTNRSALGEWRYPIVVYDDLNEQLIVHSGYRDTYTNETWLYDISSNHWEESLIGPEVRYGADAAWDTVNNMFVLFGGRYMQNFKDVWAYLPSVPGYSSSGELKSSVFDPGHRINPRSISFNVTNQNGQGIDEFSVKVRVAGSDKSAEDATKFIGPNGMTTSYYTTNSGKDIHAALQRSKYIAYKINLSTKNPLYSPELDRIVINYYTYPSTYSFESSLYEVGNYPGLPLRFVDWTKKEPEGTGMEIYFRQGSNKVEINSLPWEKVTSGQKEFGYKGGNYFQYKVVLNTDDPSVTPMLTKITFTYNIEPSKPNPVSPENNSWIGDPTPVLSWDFIDRDNDDSQSALEVIIGHDITLSQISYTSGIVESLVNGYKINNALDDGNYYWRVRLRDNYQSWGPWSDSMNFNIDTTKPDAPRIDCYTHIIETLWYDNNQPRFDWNEPEDITGIEGFSYVLDQSPDGVAPDEIIMPIDDYRFKRNMMDFNGFLIQENLLLDGTWYLHLKARDSLGYWSDTSTRMVKVDTNPPEIVDYTSIFVKPGEDLEFRFQINDEASGVDLATISWRYAYDADFQYDELVLDGNGFYTFTHKLQYKTDPYLEYYVSVNDLSEPSHAVKYPAADVNKINIEDGVPPKILKSSGSFVQNRYNNLDISVRPVDDLGISGVKIFFNDDEYGQPMTENIDGTYSIEFSRNKIKDLIDDAYDNEILYHIIVWDFNNNSARAPESGRFNITLTDLESDGEDPVDTKKDDGIVLSRDMIVTLVTNIIIIIVVALVLYIFIRKHSEKIDTDRHTLRMAIADVTETSSFKNDNQISDIKPIDGSLPAPSFKDTDSYNLGQQDKPAAQGSIFDMSPSPVPLPTASPTPVPVPSPEGTAQPIACLPEATGPSQVSTNSQLECKEKNGFAVTLPDQTKADISSNNPTPQASPTASPSPVPRDQSSRSSSGFWKPPAQGDSWTPPDSSNNLDLTKAKRI
jgi:N-acetylneuraminic acid mutarotase